ncbi:CCN family member 5 [Erpetoichthys calabaricus]|uniref:CCN family member 5 n=1 Tax=Erpetoichthys calabaricus TaxID=27687 RepID=UPI0010A081B8|nr:CCN family member 5 [Erpetoichthys calabaricus]
MNPSVNPKVLSLSLVLCVITKVCSQICRSPCYCPWTVPRCAPGVSLVLDGCGCCRVCARQQGEPCNERHVCDHSKGLYCDYSRHYLGVPGVCEVSTAQENSMCEMDGKRYTEGQIFQPTCRLQCHCMDGGITCVPLCTEDVRLSTPECPNPRRVQVPGKCCQEWICEKHSNFLQNALPAFTPDASTYGVSHFEGLSPFTNCIEHSTEWSACSKMCGIGVSTRVTNKNPECRLEKKTRLCINRPCRNMNRRTALVS